MTEDKRTHELKTWPEVFAAVWDRSKPFEVRKNDRDYHVGDRLLLREFDKASQAYTGREVACEISYILFGGAYGLPDDLCVMALVDLVNN